MSKTVLVDQKYNTSVDAASYFLGTWFQYTHAWKAPVKLGIQAAFGTAASLTMYVSDTPYGTTVTPVVLNEGSTIGVAAETMSYYILPSKYYNFKAGATTTVREFILFAEYYW